MVHVIILMSDDYNYYKNNEIIPTSISNTNIGTIFNNIINAFIGELSYTIVCFNEHINNNNMLDVIKLSIKNYKLLTIDKHNKGLNYTLSQILNNINDNDEIIITFCDYIIYWSYYNFLLNCRLLNLDACIPTINSMHPLYKMMNNYGYIHSNNNKITEIVFDDKKARDMICGIYYFKYGKYIKEYINILQYDDIVEKYYQLSYINKLLIKDNLLVEKYDIDFIYRISTITDIDYFNNKIIYFKEDNIDYSKNINNYFSNYLNKVVAHPFKKNNISKNCYLKQFNNKCIIIFHQGWGDLFSCNALLKFISEQFKETVCFIRKDATNMYEYAYKKLKIKNNIKFLYIDKSYFDSIKIIYHIISQININNDYTVLAFGGCFDKLNSYSDNWNKYCNYDTTLIYAYSQGFYNSYRIDLSFRFNYFNVDRDLIEENNIYNKYVSTINNKKYVLKHDDPSRNMCITKIDNEYPLINLNGLSDIFYDTFKLMEEAVEIHLIDSSYSILIYYMQNYNNEFLKNKKICLHKYCRPHNNYNIYREPIPNWIFVE